ncbi:MAG: MaoC family dehydratase [Dehalococcoidia bacterium]
MQATIDTPIGAAIPELKGIATNVHARTDRTTEANIHDDVAAQKLGFARGFVAGGQSIAWISRALVHYFGPSYFQTGRFEATYVSPVFDQDPITIKGTVRERIPEGDGVRLVLDVWLEREDGTKSVVGAASAVVKG